jgi:hypothetical protein
MEHAMATQLRRLATLAFHRRRTFLAAWLLVVVAVVGFYAAAGSSINSDFTIPGSSSQDARDYLEKALPPAAGTSAQIVFQSPAGTRITDAKYRSAVEATLARAKRGRACPGRRRRRAHRAAGRATARAGRAWVGRAGAALRTAAPSPTRRRSPGRSGTLRAPQRVFEQRRLADALLPAQHERATAPRSHTVQQPGEDVGLASPPQESRTVWHGGDATASSVDSGMDRG